MIKTFLTVSNQANDWMTSKIWVVSFKIVDNFIIGREKRFSKFISLRTMPMLYSDKLLLCMDENFKIKILFRPKKNLRNPHFQDWQYFVQRQPKISPVQIVFTFRRFSAGVTVDPSFKCEAILIFCNTVMFGWSKSSCIMYRESLRNLFKLLGCPFIKMVPFEWPVLQGKIRFKN